MIKPGEFVTRRSYGSDLLFKVVEVDYSEKIAVLKGMQMRLLADAPLDDLIPAEEKEISRFQTDEKNLFRSCVRNCLRQRQMQREKIINKTGKNSYYEIPGRVVHLDGDPDYLQQCIKLYSSLGLDVHGESMPEKEMPVAVKLLLVKYSPDMLVITGYDAYLKGRKLSFDSLDSYRNSRYFVEAVKRARKYEPGKDDLIIFAGACQSHYEAILSAGANFASSPQRVLIHALDPVLVMEGVGFTPISRSVDLFKIIEATITSYDGIGGIETRGQFRLGVPRSPY